MYVRRRELVGCYGCVWKSKGIQGLLLVVAGYPQLSGDNRRARNESLKEALKCSEGRRFEEGVPSSTGPERPGGKTEKATEPFGDPGMHEEAVDDGHLRGKRPVSDTSGDSCLRLASEGL